MTNLQLLFQFGNDAYVSCNKKIARKLDLNCSVLIGELISEYHYWYVKNQLTPDGFFYSTVENIQEQTTLSDYQQRASIEKLKSVGILDVCLKGLPATRHFRINCDAFIAFISDDAEYHADITEQVANDTNVELEPVQVVDVQPAIPVSTIRSNPNNLAFTNIKSSLNADTTSSTVIKKSKVTNADLCKNKTRELFSSMSVIEKLDTYFDTMKFEKQINVGQWEAKLQNLKSIATTEQELLATIELSYRKNWRDFYKQQSQQYKNTPYIAPQTSDVKPVYSDEVF